MGNRVNPHRRLLAAQAALKRELQSGYDPDGGKLQQGRVRCALTRQARWIKPALRPHSKFGDEPEAPVKVLGGKLYRY